MVATEDDERAKGEALVQLPALKSHGNNETAHEDENCVVEEAGAAFVARRDAHNGNQEERHKRCHSQWDTLRQPPCLQSQEVGSQSENKADSHQHDEANCPADERIIINCDTTEDDK